jgi:hypothetical protein
VAEQVLAAVAAGDRAALRRLLHPYLHWTEGDRTIRGRDRVLGHLAEHPVSASPAACELRDGQVYRWTC